MCKYFLCKNDGYYQGFARNYIPNSLKENTELNSSFELFLSNLALDKDGFQQIFLTDRELAFKICHTYNSFYNDFEVVTI